MVQTDVMHFSEERNVIKANPLMETLRATRLIQIFTIVLLLAVFIILFTTDEIIEHGSFLSGHSDLYIYLFAVLTNIFSLTVNIRQTRYWKKIEQRRFAAIQEHRTLFNAEQPTLLAEPMWQPGTLKLRYTKNSWLRIVGVALLIALLLAGAASLDGSLLFTSNPLSFFLVFFCITAILFLASICILLFYSIRRQKIAPTEYGLTTYYAGKTTTVMWSEARLFAFYDTFGIQESGASITYELSSAREIVRWIWIQRKTPLASQEPVISQDEYNGYMQGLIALVQQRTGLPLYDLRELGEG